MKAKGLPRLRPLRIAADFTQQGLGKAIGVSHAAIWQYENGVSDPSLDTLSRIVEALSSRGQKVTANDLLGAKK